MFAAFLNTGANMSLWCECKDCGGQHDFIVCENKLMDLQIEVWKSQREVSRLKIVAFALCLAPVVLWLVCRG